MEMHGRRELALSLRRRQKDLQAMIAAEDPGLGVTNRLRYLAMTKEHTDQLLADIAAEVGWQDGYHQALDKEIERRTSRMKEWGTA